MLLEEFDCYRDVTFPGFRYWYQQDCQRENQTEIECEYRNRFQQLKTAVGIEDSNSNKMTVKEFFRITVAEHCYDALRLGFLGHDSALKVVRKKFCRLATERRM